MKENRKKMWTQKLFFIAYMMLFSSVSQAQAQAAEFLQVTAYEKVSGGSAISTGQHRSYMVSAQADGAHKEIALKDFSLGASKLFGARKKNAARVRGNDAEIAEELARLATEGWELYSVVSVWVDATAAADAREGVNTDEKYLVTRYLLKRKK